MSENVAKSDVIPSIDLTGGSDLEIARAIDDACQTVGFYSITGHGIPNQAIEDVFVSSRLFFALSEEEKRAIHISKTHPHQRGYAPFFEETIYEVGQQEYKEAFDMGRPLPSDDPDVLAGVPFHAANVWPENIDGFRETMEHYHGQVLLLAERLVRLTALGLGLPEGYFYPDMNKAIANLRLLRYPPEHFAGSIGPENTHVTGVGPHTDYGFLTILADDGVPGLEIKTKNGDWVAVPSKSGALVVNTGELLQRWTNDRYTATVHRVSNKTDQERFSIPFFLNTNFTANVKPVPTCIAQKDEANAETIQGGPYLTQRFEQTFAYRSP